MNPIIIYAIVGVLIAGVVLAIPFMLLKRKRKQREVMFAKNNKDKAILHLYSDKSKIDGESVNSLNYIKGQYGQLIVALSPGIHSFEGQFNSTENSLGGRSNAKSEILKFNLNLDAGHLYTLGLYFYSPEERRNYYKGDVGVDVFTLELDVIGGGLYSKGYIICYQES